MCPFLELVSGVACPAAAAAAVPSDDVNVGNPHAARAHARSSGIDAS